MKIISCKKPSIVQIIEIFENGTIHPKPYKLEIDDDVKFFSINKNLNIIGYKSNPFECFYAHSFIIGKIELDENKTINLDNNKIYPTNHWARIEITSEIKNDC